MKNSPFSTHSETDWDFLHRATDEDIDLSDIPEITPEQISHGVARFGGKPIPEGKVRINMYLDADLVAFFKARAGGRGYQTLINDTLRDSIRHEDLENMLRRIIREELASTS